MCIRKGMLNRRSRGTNEIPQTANRVVLSLLNAIIVCVAASRSGIKHQYRICMS